MRITNNDKGMAEFKAFKELLNSQEQFEIIQISKPYEDIRNASKTSRVYIKIEKNRGEVQHKKESNKYD